MTFQIGNTVRLIRGRWLDSKGVNLVGGKYKVVADNSQTEYYVDGVLKTVELHAVREWESDFVLVLTEDAPKPSTNQATFLVGDHVELLERYDHQLKGQRGVVTSIEKSHCPSSSQMIYVDFGSVGVRGRPIGMYNYRVKPVASGPAALLDILRMIEATSKRVGTGDTQAILFSLMEEVGELATEINIENGTKDREPSEDGVEGEAIDVLVVIGDLLTSLFGSLESAELRTKVAAKLAKWERNAQ